MNDSCYDTAPSILDFGIWNLFGFWSLGFGFFSSGFGIWDLGFRSWPPPLLATRRHLVAKPSWLALISLPFVHRHSFNTAMRIRSSTRLWLTLSMLAAGSSIL